STTSITAIAPPGTGVQAVTVTNAAGTSSLTSVDQFTYFAAPTVTGVSPSLGSVNGTNTVTITGTNFNSVTGVTFGGVPGVGVIGVNTTTVTVTAPPNPAGTVDVVVTASGGSSAVNVADQYRYTEVVTNVTSSTANGSYNAGANVSIQVS